jgi:hypothetical protein
MKDKKELFIIGAGSSAELKFPCWEKLSEILLEKISKGEHIAELEVFFKNTNRDEDYVRSIQLKVIKLIEDVNKGTYSTVDEAITSETENIYGSEASDLQYFFWYYIAAVLLDKENESKNKLVYSWVYKYFSKSFDQIKDRHREETYIKNYLDTFFMNRRFIIFNYDRLFEMCMCKSVEDLFINNDFKFKKHKDHLQGIFNNFSSRCFHPHSYMGFINYDFSHGREKDKMIRVSPFGGNFRDDPEVYGIDFGDKSKQGEASRSLISCHDADKDNHVFAKLNKNILEGCTHVYIMGIGSGSLETNLDKLFLGKNYSHSIKNVVYSCYIDEENSLYVAYLQKNFPSAKYQRIKNFNELENLL